MNNLDHLTECWELSTEQRVNLEKYYVLHWSTDYFMGHNPIHYSSIAHQGTVYTVLPYKCTFNDIVLSGNVRLSFRKHKLHKTGYVLVMPHRNAKQRKDSK